MKRNKKLLEFLIGPCPTPAAAFARLGLGILFPALIFAYALRCIVIRRALIIGKGHLDHVEGLPAVAVGVAYACAALLLYVHVCWDDHPKFGGLRDFARQILLLAIATFMVSTFALALL